MKIICICLAMSAFSLSAEVIDAAAFGFSPDAAPEVNARALQQACEGGKLRVEIRKAGCYRMGGPVWLDDDTEIVCVKGTLLKKATTYSHMLINRGAMTGVTNVNITIRGLSISDAGLNSSPPPDSALQGLWGHLSFWRVKNLLISDFSCTEFAASQYCVQVVSFDGFTIENFIIRGKKDGVHLNSGRNFVIRNGRFCTGDDGIAINAGEWPGFTPEMGSINDGLIENIVDEPGGGCNFARVITGAWTSWHSGMKFQRADIFAHDGRTYIVYPAPLGTNETVSVTPPTHTKGLWKSPEGINFICLQPDLWRQASITNVTFRNCTLNEGSRGFLCQWEHGPWARLIHPDVPASEYPVIDIRLENVTKTVKGSRPLVYGEASARISFDGCHAANGVLAEMGRTPEIRHSPSRTFVVNGKELPTRVGATILRENDLK